MVDALLPVLARVPLRSALIGWGDFGQCLYTMPPLLVPPCAGRLYRLKGGSGDVAMPFMYKHGVLEKHAFAAGFFDHLVHLSASPSVVHDPIFSWGSPGPAQSTRMQHYYPVESFPERCTGAPEATAPQ